MATPVHASRTGRHAGKTAEAEIHFIGERFRWLQPLIGNGPHQGDATARAVAFQLGGVVGRTSRQAQTTVHALLDHGVIQSFEVGDCPELLALLIDS